MADAATANGVLYISHDGVLEPLGQSQVLAYLEKLALERPIHLVSFEKASDWARTGGRQATQDRLVRAGIAWHPLRYHRRPPVLSTLWSMAIGTLVGLWLVLRHRLGIVHARSYVAGMMALAIKRMTGARFLFDMRGFWVDERVDGGLWPKGGRLYRIGKWCERRLLLDADHVVSLTEAGVREMRRFDWLQARMPATTVIPTCADLSRFSIAGRVRRGEERFVLGYVGSAGTWYLFDEVARAVKIAMELRPDLRFQVLNRGEHDRIRTALSQAAVPLTRVDILSATHAEVPGCMARMDAALFFIKPVFSKQASAPTKLAEFLGCGVPCMGNAGVGDMADVLQGEGVGVVAADFAPQTLRSGLQELFALAGEDGIAARCAEAAARHFSLDEGVRRYAGIYAELLRA